MQSCNERENKVAKNKIITSVAIMGSILFLLFFSIITISINDDAAQETANNNNITNATSLANVTATSAATRTTIVTMILGSQNPSNEQFYNPSKVTVLPGSRVILKNQDTSSIHPPQVRMQYLIVHLILDLLLQVSLVNQ